MRLLTFQTENVIDIINNNGEYLADISKSREKRDYKLDIEQLNGYNPIWCFYPIDTLDKTLKIKNKFLCDDFKDGILFQTFRCEMSLRNGIALNNFILIEIEIGDNNIKIGKTHNSYSGAVVIPKISKEDVIATYKVIYSRGIEGNRWYFPDVKVIKLYKTDSIFTDDFTCTEDEDE